MNQGVQKRSQSILSAEDEQVIALINDSSFTLVNQEFVIEPEANQKENPQEEP